jgi:hypothetical protein
VTLLFTDVEGSTPRCTLSGRRTATRSRSIAQPGPGRDRTHDGVEVDMQGDAAVPRGVRQRRAALHAARDAQRGLAAAIRLDGVALKVRMGLHTGEPEQRDPGLDGPPRQICAAVLGGQNARRGRVVSRMPGAAL